MDASRPDEKDRSFPTEMGGAITWTSGDRGALAAADMNKFAMTIASNVVPMKLRLIITRHRD